MNIPQTSAFAPDQAERSVIVTGGDASYGLYWTFLVLSVVALGAIGTWYLSGIDPWGVARNEVPLKIVSVPVLLFAYSVYRLFMRIEARWTISAAHVQVFHKNVFGHKRKGAAVADIEAIVLRIDKPRKSPEEHMLIFKLRDGRVLKMDGETSPAKVAKNLEIIRRHLPDMPVELLK